MNFMTTEGDRSGIDTLSKREKAGNILFSMLMTITAWKSVYSNISDEQNLKTIKTLRDYLDTMERLINARRS